MEKPTFIVTGKLEIFEGKAAWTYLRIHHLEVPPAIPGGWGSIPIYVTLGKSTWRTAIFPYKLVGYFLPIKKAVLKSEVVKVGDKVTIKYSSI